MKQRWSIFLLFLSVILLGMFLANTPLGFANDAALSSECDPLGWFPDGFDLKDHSVFIFDDYYYLVSNYLPGERKFAYARSPDLCHWENLSPILEQRTSQWDGLAIWAPFVLEDDGIFYMYYTGVKGPYPYLTQSIMLATTSDPADPDSWEQQGMIFQPNHPNMIWQDSDWADCRDPYVFIWNDSYYLLYTGLDEDGGIVGLATATGPRGPWQDLGSILTLDVGIPESSLLWWANDGYYLFYNHSGGDGWSGEKYRFGLTLEGPWSKASYFAPGWAHEIWFGMDGQTYTSYLTDYTVTINTLLWSSRYDPPRPFIGKQIAEIFIPIIVR